MLSAYKVEDKELSVYQQAKEQYEQANYSNCQTLLTPLLASKQPTSLNTYAFFYYALAAYRDAKPDVAEQTFTKLLYQNPTWEQSNEVIYWLAQLRFEQKDYSAALSYLTQIKDPAFEDAISRMKTHFLQQDLPTYLLTSLLNQHPHDHTIAHVWLRQQVQSPFMQQDTSRMRQVAQRLNLLDWLYDPLAKVTSIKKDTYHVAIFLPLFIDEVNYEEKNSNHFVIDLYQGIQAAVGKLQQEGISIELHAYDTKKSTAITAELLTQKEMKNMDLFIGPLYANTFPLVATFAKANGINLFNPLSVNSSVVNDNALVYLGRSSIETQAKQAAHFMLQQPDFQEARIGIVHGSSPEDILKANTYKQHIEQHGGKTVDQVIALDLQDSQHFLSRLRNASKKQESPAVEDSLNLDALTHIYIASQDELLVANVLSAIQIKRLKLCIIGDEAWLKKSIVTIDQLAHMRIHFVAPDYIDYDKKSLHLFRSSFYEQFGIYPTYYASLGYDMMLFLGKMLFQYGTYFQKHWENVAVPGEVFFGFSYEKNHDNQCIPVIQFQKSQFVVVGGMTMQNSGQQ
jgi:hypothetical protein